MRAGRAAGLTATLALLLTGLAAPALAADPVTLGAGYVLDDVDVLTSSEETQVDGELTQFASDTGLNLWVVYVDTFENPSSSEEWANQVALDNGLGPTQYLLAVATDSRQYYLSGDSSGPVSPEQLATIEQQRVQPALADGDMAGAAVAAAAGLEDAAGGGSGAAAASGSGGGFGTILVIVSIVALVGVVVYFLLRRRRRRSAAAPSATAAPPAQISIEELARRAASALVQTDDAIRTSEQELGFARAQFGDTATTDFAAVLTQAKDDLARAFTLQQQLDDEVPDAPEQIRALHTEILELCEHANAALDEKADDFDELRKLEQNAPEAFSRVQEDRVQATEGIDEAAQRLQQLSAEYAPEALATVADNAEQARSRLAFADEQLTQAQAAIGAGDGATAAIGIRAAEEAVGQAHQLETAIHSLASALAEGEKGALALITDIEGDLATVAALPDPDGRLARAAEGARAQIDTARENLSGTAKRPLVTLHALEQANAGLDELLAGARDAQAQTDRARKMLDQVVVQAQAQVSAAEDFITARRGAVGAQARTRLAEAGAALTQARGLAAVDPTQALQLAQRAEQLAQQSIQSAQRDVGAFSPGMAGGSPRGGGGSMMGAVLGGIVVNSLLQGGGRGMGSGLGGMTGGGRGRSGRSGFSGGFSPGSFGGGGTRGRRGGGRF